MFIILSARHVMGVVMRWEDVKDTHHHRFHSLNVELFFRRNLIMCQAVKRFILINDLILEQDGTLMILFFFLA